MLLYDAILFDFDGVLMDSEPIHFECWRDVLAQYGVVLEWKTYEERCVGVSDREMIEALCGGNSSIIEQVWRQYPAKKEAFRRRIADAPPFLAETIETVRALNGYRLAVVSSSGRSEVEPPLVKVGLREYFGAIVCGEDVRRHKPAPEPYLMAASLLGAGRPLVVEDSAAGLASATAAGFDALHIPHPAGMPALLREKLRLSR